MNTKNRRKPLRIIPIAREWYAIFTIIGFVIFWALIKCDDRRNDTQYKSDCELERNRSINGVVSNAFFDKDINRKAFVIEFANKTTYVFPVFLKDLNGYVEIGDSIEKKAGEFKFTIFKKGYEHPIVIQDTVNCNESKK